MMPKMAAALATCGESETLEFKETAGAGREETPRVTEGWAQNLARGPGREC